jgi:hypothetical protein
LPQHVWVAPQAAPPLHGSTHVLATHTSPAGHCHPHDPQFSASVVTSLHPVVGQHD